MRKSAKVLIILMFSITACRQNIEKIERQYLDKTIKEVNIDGDYRWVIILPGLGCHGCIKEGEVFMKEHITDKRILFLVTKVSSIKILQQKTGVSFDEHSNIFIDRNNLFDIPTDNRIYPCVVELKNGEVINHSFQSPKNAAFHQLEQQLK